MMMCHRFYTRQSHAKNCWHTVASSCILLASKLRDSPRFLDDVVFVVYECEIQDAITDMMTRKKLNPLDMKERDEFSKGRIEVLKREKKELIIKAERLVLQTIGLDDIEDPYKALVVALKMFMMSDKITDLTKMAWSLVEEWLKTSLCLQYEPNYIAVGSVVVAARVLGMKLPAGENFWLKELDVSPKLLDEVVRLMQSRIGERETKKTIRIVSFYEITCR
ncbi:cyclin-T1-5-like [Argentina anserina]|uniref:cyclin-T1-5-like n=1 Tax=Argentina anserina TaxID=57926 RepID=UPI0021767F72|nr:cyclin-T1-5-like [Potentilla anserina]